MPPTCPGEWAFTEGKFGLQRDCYKTELIFNGFKPISVASLQISASAMSQRKRKDGLCNQSPFGTIFNKGCLDIEKPGDFT